MTAILVTGYKSFEVGVFTDKDPKLAVIKTAIRKDLVRLFDQGVDWLIFTGNLGFEVWVLEIALELKEEYGVKLATLFAFEDQGKHWNEGNQAHLSKFRSLDFVKYSYSHYESPAQLRFHNQFLLENTSGAYLFYDEGHETNLKYLLAQIADKEGYDVTFLTFERLNTLWEED